MSSEHSRLVCADSLGETLDAINEALFFARPLSQRDKTAAANWIAARQGLPRSYAGMFAPTQFDFQHGMTVFTGEKVRSLAATSHILGQEACRALRLLAPLPAKAEQALSRATVEMDVRVHCAGSESRGSYCCTTCTCAVWRHMLAGGLAPSERFIAAGLAALAMRRDGKGRWRGHPFYYTLLCLVEMPQPQALAELRYSAPSCERVLRRKAAADDKYARRRMELSRRVLARC